MQPFLPDIVSPLPTIVPSSIENVPVAECWPDNWYFVAVPVP